VNAEKLQSVLERQVRYAAANRLEDFQRKFRALLEEVCADYPGIMIPELRPGDRSSMTIAGLTLDVAAKLGRAMGEIDVERFRNGMS
jgi:hypothetical protein